MKYLLAWMLLLASPAWAEWSPFGETANGDKYYLDLTTFRKDGGFIRIWELRNFSQKREFAKTQGVLSTRYRTEWDCKNEKMRYLTMSAHSELDARGEVLNQDQQESRWHDIAPSTLIAEKLKLFCKYQ